MGRAAKGAVLWITATDSNIDWGGITAVIGTDTRVEYRANCREKKSVCFSSHSYLDGRFINFS